MSSADPKYATPQPAGEVVLPELQDNANDFAKAAGHSMLTVHAYPAFHQRERQLREALTALEACKRERDEAWRARHDWFAEAGEANRKRWAAEVRAEAAEAQVQELQAKLAEKESK